VGYHVIGPDHDPEGEPRRAVYPLGRGMPDVQLLVLNGEQQVAGVGELGEIHVRSPHLARGYLGDEALTAACFPPNPFTGADSSSADRLYRTGDLGRYLPPPGGEVEFAGRADRQIKIRGFRIEPAEIEAALIQSPEVREAVVLARDDAPGGRGLVAYLIGKAPAPSCGGDPARLPSLRAFLQERLPGYMIPSAWVWLEALPLTPNGKVDLCALPKPDYGTLAKEEGVVAPRDRIESQLAEIWEKVLNVQPVGVRDSFFELGGHSLLGIQLFARIEQAFGKKLPVATLFQSPTVEGIAALLRGEGGTPDWSTLVPIQPQGSRPPFFCVHGFGGGVLGYADLARLLGPDQPFYGLQARGLDGREEPDDRIEDMAARYLQAIRSLQPHGPYYLGGYCQGGIVAFEAACQLQAQGEKVALLAIMEGYAISRSEARQQVWRPRHVARFLLNLPFWVRDRLLRIDAHNPVVYRLRRWAGAAWQQVIREWNMPVVQDLIAGIVGDAQQAGLSEETRRVMETHLRAVGAYHPHVYPGRVSLFRVRALPLFRSYDPTMGWGKLAAGGVEIRMVAGAHYNIMEKPHVEALAAQLRESLDRARAAVSCEEGT
jgi:thioesterase domain-containing protein/acyl carrier protein